MHATQLRTNRTWPASHDHASTIGHPSSLGGSLRRRPGNIFDDLAHELARRSRTLRVPITPHLLSHLEPLHANKKIRKKVSSQPGLLANETWFEIKNLKKRNQPLADKSPRASPAADPASTPAA